MYISPKRSRTHLQRNGITYVAFYLHFFELTFKSLAGTAAMIFKDQVSWRGHFGAHTTEQRLGNGQWTVLIHSKTAGAATGAAGGVVYKLKDGTELFAG